MRFMRQLLVVLIVFVARIAEAQAAPAPAPAPPLDLVDRIEVAEKAWSEAMATEPQFVSLGAFTELSAADVVLTSVLRERLKLLNRKVFSNRRWREHWVEQHRAAAALESLYDERVAAAGAAEREERADKKSGARDWAALAEANVSNQDTFLVSLQTEHDAVEERLENTLFSAAASGQATPRPAQVVGGSPFEERAAHIADVRFRQAFQNERRAVASLEVKLIGQQVKASSALQPALEVNVELAQEEHRIAKEQLLSPDRNWSRRWASMATAAAAKLKKIEDERDLGEARQRSLEFDMSLAESQLAYRDKKSAQIEQEREQAEAFSGWLEAMVATVRRQAPRVIGLLLLILIVGWLAMRMVGLATRAIVRFLADDDPDSVTAGEQRTRTIASVFRGIGKIVVSGVAILLACDVVGIDTGPILGSVAIFGLALSFGSQNLVRDFVNGFFVIVENQYAVGDWVKIGEHEGAVEQINIRSTRLRSMTGVLQIIPNGTITTVENMTRDWSCFNCHVRVSYDTDIDIVERICNEVGAEMYADPELKDTLAEAPTFVGVTQLADSAVVVRSSAKTHAGAQWGLEREMNRRLKKAFEEAGIEIPLPQRVVWQRNRTSG